LKLTVKNLSVFRGGRQVIKDLSFFVQAGDALIVKGTNGSGKTTLLRALAGFLKPVSGTIQAYGVGHSEESRPQIGELCHYVGHLNAIKASQTVAETLNFYAGYFDQYTPEAERNKRIDAALDRFQLTALASVPSGYLSAGQKRRLGLARLLCVPRSIWLLDEPTTSLDQKSSAILSQIITEHVKNSGLVVAATHLDLGLDTAEELHLGVEAQTA